MQKHLLKRKWLVGFCVLIVFSGLGVWKFVILPQTQSRGADPVEEKYFEEVTNQAGITFQHFDPATSLHLMPETMGSGLAWIDYDADGWPDLFFVQDGPLPPATMPNPPTHRLYRNNRDGTFTDVTRETGLDHGGFGTGVAVGDYDNDGFDDLAIAYLGGIELWHNVPNSEGKRHFQQTTSQAKLTGTNPHYATSMAWGDLDGDGFLDLYVCNYVEIDPAKPVICKHPLNGGTYYQCSPTTFPLTTHRLYRNLRNGTFEDVSIASGVTAPKPASGLAVVIVDLDDDGRLDVFVANDMHPAFLFHNQTERGGPIKLIERAELAGCGLGPGGGWMSGMCAEAADINQSQRASLFVTNFQNEPNVLFRNRGKLQFDEVSMSSGLGGPSRNRLGFGATFLDVDLDGNLDLLVANGHVQRVSREISGVPYAQEQQLFRGNGKGQFQDVSSEAGRAFLKPRVGRGLARCDFDNDGKPDFALSSVGESAALFRNRTQTAHSWINLDLRGNGTSQPRNPIGAVVTVEAGSEHRTYFVTGGGSYLSASDYRLAIGLGPDVTVVNRVNVKWPSGERQTFENLEARTFWRLHGSNPKPERVR